MKPMTWHPGDRDKEINAYLDRSNHAPYESILAIAVAAVCLITFLILMGSF